MSTLQIVIFNVGAGQSIFVYPNDQPEYSQLIDCGGDADFSPVEYLTKSKLLPNNRLGSLVITNYDHDHFSWLPDLWSKVSIWTTRLPKNISSQELKNHKEEITNALLHVCHIKDTYISNAVGFSPIHQTFTYHLDQGDLEGGINTNHLSQIVFIEYAGSKICIAGDLEKSAWEKILQRQEVRNHLIGTNVLVAPHHGRENGYYESIFTYCKPETIIISDKELMYGTQDGMAQKYSTHVIGDGINFSGIQRKTVTTRSDGHILINFGIDGKRSYSPLNIE